MRTPYKNTKIRKIQKKNPPKLRKHENLHQYANQIIKSDLILLVSMFSRNQIYPDCIPTPANGFWSTQQETEFRKVFY